MMAAAAEVLTYAERHGINLFVENGQLILEGIHGTLSPEFVEQAKKHKPELLLMAIIRQAVKGLKISPGQFQALLSEDDKELIRKGKFPSECLRAYAMSFAEGISTGRILFHPVTQAIQKHGLPNPGESHGD